ncbi:effector binding domain-containing protein [Litoribacter ruber]|uniref:Effector binding domain-containing protein n=1 Tax=Litoribacter ruber TaxID=702568 RepID=A0AAP2CFU7_9BACT|nr:MULTISPECIES: effector binding domain-containing protein [Litoribacter]MBS9523247.1 effector binding domain-containing protein [Litoribacter alkaliphilus]MBT0810590.1 effector binding domain-containing protein [Litoribacter ruber]
MKKLKLKIVNIKSFPVIGLATKCVSHDVDSDFFENCDEIWKKFVTGGYSEAIPNKVNDNIIAAYFNFEGDSTKPFEFLVGCQVTHVDEIPEGMQTFEMDHGPYLKVRSHEKIPECHSAAWKEIWESDIDRKYSTDFEVYSSEIQDWRNAEMDIYIGIEGKLDSLEKLPEHIEVSIEAHE